MKALSLALVLGLIFLFSLHAAEFHTIKKNIPLEEGNFLLLEDLSCYVIYPVKKNRDIFSKFILRRDIPQVDRKFLFSHNLWKEGTVVSLQEQCWKAEDQQEINSYHQPNLSSCFFLFTNVPNTQAAFGKSISFPQAIDLFAQLAKFRYEEGRKKGIASCSPLGRIF